MILPTSPRQRRVWRCAAFVLVLGVALAMGPAAQAGTLTINITYDPSITNDSNHVAIEGAIQAAANSITSHVTSPNNLTASIYIGETPGFGLGASLSTRDTTTYGNFYNLLAPVMTSPTQMTALASLPANGINPVVNGAGVRFTSAEGRNLGAATPGTTTPEAFNIAAGSNFFSGPNLFTNYDTVIGLNTQLTNPGGGSIALQVTANHELDEALGIGGPGSNLGRTDQNSFVGDLDLYRYSGAGVRDYTTLDQVNPFAYFSIDGGSSIVSYFNQAGGGSDYADWYSEIPGKFPPQVQDAFANNNTANTPLGPSEFTAFTAIGYGLSSQIPPSATPEPGTLLLLGQGVAVFGLVWRNQRTRRHEK